MKSLILIILFLFSNKLLAQQTKTIQIKFGASGKPVAKKYFYLLQDNDTNKGIFQLDDQGSYEIPIYYYPQNFNLQILFFYDGYKTIRENINLKDSNIQVFNIYRDSTYVPKKTGLFYKSTAIRYFGEYEPINPNSINDLPDTIKYKLENHLKSRVGDSFYAKLHLTYGQILDLDRLYKVSYNAKDYKWTPYSYYLFFGFENASKGIGQYNAKIVLDKHGNVIEEIELPDVKNNPEKSNTISLKQIKKIARKNGFDPNGEIELSFNTKVNSIVWNFTKVISDQGFSFETSTLSIDAHSGKIIGTYPSFGIR